VRFHESGGTRGDIDLIGDIAKNMLGRTFCPLGDAAAMPTISIVEKFRSEFEEHLGGKCSAGGLAAGDFRSKEPVNA
jgi:NADH-quinone oxidoreductase subunit F